MEPIQIILLASLIVLVGHFVKGLTGFASSFIIVPLLSLFLDIKFVVPIMALFTFTAGLLLFLATRKQIERKDLLLVLIFMIIGSFIGVKILANYNSTLLKRLFGILVILFSLEMIYDLKNKIVKKVKRFWGAIAGFIAGILGGMFDTNGPPIAIYFGHQLKKETFRATITAIFFLDSIFRNALYINAGITTLEVLKFALFLLPALIIGLILGSKIHLKVDEILFRKIVAFIILIAGILLVL